MDLPRCPLTGEDALALALLRGIIAAPGLPQEPRLAATLDKLAGSLSPASGEMMREAGRVLQPGQSAWDYSPAPLTTGAARTVRIEYRSHSRGDTRLWQSVDSYVVEARAGQFWELHSWRHRNQCIRTFALDQVFGMREWGSRIEMRGGKPSRRLRAKKTIEPAEDSLSVYTLRGRREDVVEAYGRDSYRDFAEPLIIQRFRREQPTNISR